MRTPVTLIVIGALSACTSITEGDKVNYKTEGSAKTVALDVPPDLTQLTRDSRYTVPGGSVTARGMLAPRPAQTESLTAAKQVNDVRLERDGQQRWLVVNRSAESVWPIVHQFWIENGFSYVVDQQQLGLLETEWAENRAKIPQDFIRRTLGKVLDGLYSSGERDKFRTRLERNSTGGVDIFVTHRKMTEEYKDQSKTQTIWQPQASDPELEAEFLTRLMVKLGVSADQAQQVTTNTTGQALQTRTRIESREGSQQVLVTPDSFDVAWRRIGVALDRTGFTVEDRDRSQGIYFVRYVEVPKQEEKGFFSSMFSSSKPDAGPIKYRIVVRGGMQGLSEIVVQNSSGQVENTPNTQRILKLLADDLK